MVKWVGLALPLVMLAGSDSAQPFLDPEQSQVKVVIDECLGAVGGGVILGGAVILGTNAVTGWSLDNVPLYVAGGLGYTVGSALGTWAMGSLDGQSNRIVPALLGSVAGAALGAGIGLAAHAAGAYSIGMYPILLTVPVGAVVGYNLGNSSDQQFSIGPHFRAQLPVVALAPEVRGGGMGVRVELLRGRFD